MNNYLTGLDILQIILYLLIIMAIGYSFSKKVKHVVIRKYFIRGLTLKLVCGLGFAWLYVYYYGGGDTQMYYRGARNIFETIFSSQGGIEALWDTTPELRGSASTVFTQRITGWINLFALNSFWSCTLLFAALSFIGQWLLFISFYRIYPYLHKQLAIATLFIPGVAFWSSGIMKDSLCMLAIGVIIYCVQNIFLFNRNKITSAIIVIGSFYMIIILKAYIALALLVAISLYALLSLKSRIRNNKVRILVMPIAAVIIAGSTLLAINQIGDSLKRYSLENIVETAQVYQNYHLRTSIAGRGSEVRTGSGYSLGEINYNSSLGIISKIPLAINVTFFRPYIWEVNNPVMLLSAIESIALLIFTIHSFWKVGIRRFFIIFFTSKEVIFAMSFALIFGFAVGFTTYNFGSLVRYKAPCIPFYVIALVLVQHLGYKNLSSKHLLRKKSFASYKSN